MLITKNKKGFTLIELLVVISIIGLLSSIVLAAVSDARKKAQFTASKEAFKQLQTALELYRSDNNGEYPANTDTIVEPLTDLVTELNKNKTYLVQAPELPTELANAAVLYVNYLNPNNVDYQHSAAGHEFANEGARCASDNGNAGYAIFIGNYNGTVTFNGNIDGIAGLTQKQKDDLQPYFPYDILNGPEFSGNASCLLLPPQ